MCLFHQSNLYTCFSWKVLVVCSSSVLWWVEGSFLLLYITKEHSYLDTEYLKYIVLFTSILFLLCMLRVVVDFVILGFVCRDLTWFSWVTLCGVDFVADVGLIVIECELLVVGVCLVGDCVDLLVVVFDLKCQRQHQWKNYLCRKCPLLLLLLLVFVCVYTLPL